MSLEQALQEHEEKVEVLLRQAKKYVNALQTWKKACQAGHLANLQKWASQAEELSTDIPVATEETRGSWTFDARNYLESGEWRKEVQSVASERFNLRIAEDDQILISSPVTVRAQPSRSVLQIGKITWSNLRPRLVAGELKRLRDRTASANSQEFLESLFGASRYLTAADPSHNTKFRDIYDLFCLTPGYRRENTQATFAQQIYALHRTDLRLTRGGRRIEFEFASGNYRERDVFTVIAEDSRPIRYFNIWFR